MSIHTNTQLQQALDQIERLHRIVAAYRRAVGDNPENFALYAEGALDTLRDLQAQVTAYTRGGVQEAVQALVRPTPTKE